MMVVELPGANRGIVATRAERQAVVGISVPVKEPDDKECGREAGGGKARK